MSVPVSELEIRQHGHQLADVRSAQHHLARLGQATERQTQTLVEDLRRVHVEIRDAGSRIEQLWVLILFQLGLAALIAELVVFHALGREEAALPFVPNDRR